VYADARSADRFCDQFESIDLTPKERYYLMQLIVASLDEALREEVPSVRRAGQSVERLLSRNALEYHYTLDYWSRTGIDIDLRVAPCRCSRRPHAAGRIGPRPWPGSSAPPVNLDWQRLAPR
jgi:hypothetical protein